MATTAPTDSATIDEQALAPWRDRFVQASLGGFLDTASHAPQASDHRRALDAYMGSWGAVLEPGMVFSVEPGVYLAGLGGFRHSDTVVVREEGVEVLTRTPRALDELVAR